MKTGHIKFLHLLETITFVQLALGDPKLMTLYGMVRGVVLLVPAVNWTTPMVLHHTSRTHNRWPWVEQFQTSASVIMLWKLSHCVHLHAVVIKIIMQTRNTTHSPKLGPCPLPVGVMGPTEPSPFIVYVQCWTYHIFLECEVGVAVFIDLVLYCLMCLLQVFFDSIGYWGTRVCVKTSFVSAN